MLVSVWCNSNKTSMLVSVGLYLVLILPSEYAGLATVTVSAQAAERSNVLQLLNPMGATSRLLHESIMDNATVHQLWLWVTTPALFPVVVLAVLIAYVGPALQLEGGMKRMRTRPA
jgi:hypothetical protein